MSTETMTPAIDWTEWTADQLAGFGDRVEQAQAERAAREHAEKARQRQRASDERRLAKVESQIPPLEAAIAERKPAVDKLDAMFDEQRDKVVGLLDERDHVPMSKVAEYNAAKAHLDEIARALSMAKLTGSELVEGASAMEGGGGLVMSLSPMSRRVNHPLLDEIASEIDWATPLQPLVDRLDELTKEREKLQARLKATE